MKIVLIIALLLSSNIFADFETKINNLIIEKKLGLQIAGTESGGYLIYVLKSKKSITIMQFCRRYPSEIRSTSVRFLTKDGKEFPANSKEIITSDDVVIDDVRLGGVVGLSYSIEDVVDAHSVLVKLEGADEFVVSLSLLLAETAKVAE